MDGNFDHFSENKCSGEEKYLLNLTLSCLLPFELWMSAFYPQSLTIKRATKDDQGLYECKVEDHSGNRKKKTEFIRVLEKEEPYIRC
jgi:hypothetical protein